MMWLQDSRTESCQVLYIAEIGRLAMQNMHSCSRGILQRQGYVGLLLSPDNRRD